MLLAGLIDIGYKRYSQIGGSFGLLICGAGLTWVLTHTLQMQYQHQPITLNQVTLFYGILAGMSSALANLVLVVAFRHLDISLGSTIYRLNTIGVIILSVLFLEEALSAVKLSGITLGVIAVLLLHTYGQSLDKRMLIRYGLLAAITASTLRAVFGVVSKAGLSNGADADTLLLIYAICWTVVGFFSALKFERRCKPGRQEIIYALVIGLVLYGIVTTLIAALARGEATVVVPIANMSFIVALLIAGITGMEKLNMRKILAIILAAIAIGLLTYA